MVLLYLLLALASLFFYHYNKLKTKINYWKARGVPQLNPHIIYGDTKENIFHEISIFELYTNFYYKFKEMGVKHGGIYAGRGPIWMPIDPSLIKLVVMKDFQYFSAHNPKYANTLLFNNIFHMDGEEWKDIRKKLTPTFTSGKMKMMFNILLQKTHALIQLVGLLAENKETAEIKEVLARYTTDVIGSCGFGIEVDSLKDKDSLFFRTGQNLFRKFGGNKVVPKPYQVILATIASSLGLLKYRSRSLDVSEEEDFYRTIVNETVKYREENKIVRKDFLHLMIQLRNKGNITDILNEKDIYNKTEEDSEGMSMEEVVGQCMLFISAGFETSSTTMSFALLELTQNPEVQDKMRKEVRDVLKRHNDILTYEALQELTYIDCVIRETLRKYPPLANLPRLCTKDYRIPDTDIVIEKGTNVQIPLLAIQNDPEYFPEPEKFIPERFNTENSRNIVDFTYLPFGEGPRQCLGLRFGLMQSKAGLACLINRYHFTLNSRTKYPPKFDPTAPTVTVDGGIWLNVKEVN